MLMTLLSITGQVLFSAAASSIKELLLFAIKAGADLRGADLRGAYLSGVNLRGADLRGAYLSGAYLSGADLRGVNLRGAYLSGAYLSGAYLRGADLRAAYLSGADLYGVNLYGVNLRGADLRGVNLRAAYLSGADLRGAYLSGADLRGVNLRGANLPTRVADQTTILPKGNLVGWKKCKKGVIVKLLIPQDAKRSNSTGRKCRADKVKVLRVFGANFGVSRRDATVVYRKGETVKCDKWDENRWEECSGGIHFFITRAEAEAY